MINVRFFPEIFFFCHLRLPPEKRLASPTFSSAFYCSALSRARAVVAQGEGPSREGLLEDHRLPGSIGHTGLRGMGGGRHQALGSGSAATSPGSSATKISLIADHCTCARGPVESVLVFGKENV